jgi:glycosyltransferase involved in cell wall biosynthesis
LKILIVSSLQVFPARSGGQSRTAAIAQALAANGHEVAIFSICGRSNDLFRKGPGLNPSAPHGVSEYVARPPLTTFLGLLSFKLGLFPFWATLWLLFRQHRLASLRKMFLHCHAVMADFPFTYPIFDLAAAGDKSSRPITILNTHNVEHEIALKPKLRGVVKRIEDFAARHARVVLACSDHDAAYFSKVSREPPIVVPNGIETARFAKIPSQRDQLRAEIGALHKKVILFSASSYGPNQEGLSFLKDFCEQNSAFMDENALLFLVVGSVSSRRASSPGMYLTGKVDFVEPYFCASDFAVNPIFQGGGTSVKVAEYIAAGLPILTTSVGVRGYDLRDEASCMVFSAETFKQKLIQLVTHRDTQGLAQAAVEENRQKIDIRFGIRPLISKLESLA